MSEQEDISINDASLSKYEYKRVYYDPLDLPGFLAEIMYDCSDLWC